MHGLESLPARTSRPKGRAFATIRMYRRSLISGAGFGSRPPPILPSRISTVLRSSFGSSWCGKSNPLDGTGKMELYNANPTDELHAKLYELVSNSKSDALTRHLELFKAAEKALENSVNRDSLRKLVGSLELTAGFDRELADVCVGR